MLSLLNMRLRERNMRLRGLATNPPPPRPSKASTHARAAKEYALSKKARTEGMTAGCLALPEAVVADMVTQQVQVRDGLIGSQPD